jgi:hypothetical protein
MALGRVITGTSHGNSIKGSYSSSGGLQTVNSFFEQTAFGLRGTFRTAADAQGRAQPFYANELRSGFVRVLFFRPCRDFFHFIPQSTVKTVG